MKKLITVMLFLIATSSFGQTYTKDSKGNYILTVKDTTKKSSVPTGLYVYIGKDKYPILKGPRGGLYYIDSTGKRKTLPK